MNILRDAETVLVKVGSGGVGSGNQRQNPSEAVVRETVRDLMYGLSGAQLAVVHGSGNFFGEAWHKIVQAGGKVDTHTLIQVMQSEIGAVFADEFRRQGRFAHVHNTEVLVNSHHGGAKGVGMWRGSERFYASRGLSYEAHPDRSVQLYRELADSPDQVAVADIEEIRSLFGDRVVVVCGGVGGIPFTLNARNEPEYLTGKAILNEDRTAEMIARGVGADVLLFLTHTPGFTERFHGRDMTVPLMDYPEALQRANANPKGTGLINDILVASSDFAHHSGREVAAVITNVPMLRRVLDGDFDQATIVTY